MIIALRKMFESFLENMGLIFAPIPSAVMTGVSISHYFTAAFGEIAAVSVGFAFGIAIEATGFTAFRSYQKNGSWLNPAAYVISVIAIVSIVELLVFQDPQRWGIGLTGVIITAIMYSSHAANVGGENKFNDRLAQARRLADSGMKLNSKGQIVPIPALRKRSEPTLKNTPKRLSWKTLTPEAKACISEDGYKVFQSKFGSVPESTFYGWQSRIDKEKSLNGAG